MRGGAEHGGLRVHALGAVLQLRDLVAALHDEHVRARHLAAGRAGARLQLLARLARARGGARAAARAAATAAATAAGHRSRHRAAWLATALADWNGKGYLLHFKDTYYLGIRLKWFRCSGELGK